MLKWWYYHRSEYYYKVLVYSAYSINCKQCSSGSDTFMIEIKVENIVASTTFAEKLDLDIIAQAFDEAEYEPEQFPGLVYRIKEPKVAMLLFASGKIVCAGAKSTEDALKAVEKLSEGLTSLGLLH